MSKEEILESYFNLLDYGNLRRGPAAAARFYFGPGDVPPVPSGMRPGWRGCRRGRPS